FAGFFRDWEWKRLPSALRQLGFSFVAETSVGAWHVSHATAEFMQKNPGGAHIASSCPAVVSYIERYRMERTKDLVPVFSPMLAHAKLLKERLGKNSQILFIGPCVAKKAEAERPEHAGLIDCVLTFSELLEWFELDNITLSQQEESDFDEQPQPGARYYPLLGGCMRAASLSASLLDPNVLSVSGFRKIQSALTLDETGEISLIEPLFCSEGCVGGPAIPGDGNPYDRRGKVLHYATEHPGKPATEIVPTGLFTTRFHAHSADDGIPISEEEIRLELEKTGKLDPENRLNCGACGYNTCREKAIAAIRGLAEAEMCLPYMRRLAESRTDRIIDSSPNGIILLDEHLRILSMNAAFHKMFMCSDAILGKHISYLMDPDPFEKVAAGQDLLETVVEHKQYNRVCSQKIYRIPEDNQVAGIFANITEEREREAQLSRLRAETSLQASELLEHQTQMAQTLARFLGENTARGEALVEKLLRLAKE
ncbi:TPA: hypothetical protein DDW35_10230, partial [Candidatus Sumerlaeota bacterium]|nr:hypothetical protein [Candidatus Sumerlaeota bacterium]